MMISSVLQNLSKNAWLKRVLGIFSGIISLGLFIWAVHAYHPLPTFYGPRAIYSIIVLSVALALLGRFLLLRMIRMEARNPDFRLRGSTWGFLLAFDVTAPVYLAAGVLLGVPAAVLTALITQVCVQVYTRRYNLVSWTEAGYYVATTALLVLISVGIFQYVSTFDTLNDLESLASLGTRYPYSRGMIASALSAVVLMFLLMLVSLPMIMYSRKVSLREAWWSYIHSSVPRFQLLVLSVGPLMPVVDIFDDVVAELAWLFFLIPLLAIYYLALTSTRLSIRTDELQNTLEDLSSARRRQNELRDYASLITLVQEEERRRLARELHDDTAQALVALSRGLDGLGRAVEKLEFPQKDREWLNSLQNLADNTLDGVRRACRDLRPSILDDLGLRAALEWLCDGSSNRGVISNFICIGEIHPTTPAAEIAIFRIVQEALSNVWRHAWATNVDVELRYMSDKLSLQIQDNGRGFLPEKMSGNLHGSQSGLGLLGMRERATLIGADLLVSSRPGCGCTVSLVLPLNQE